MALGLNLITAEAVDAALDEFRKLGRDAFLEKYGFGKALDYVVLDPVSRQWADSKAVVGAAYGFRFPSRGPLRSGDFSGGQVQVVRLLRELGYSIATTAEVAAEADGRSWSRAEVELLVADYLEMLTLELAGQKFNKAAKRRALMPLLNKRSDGSIEFKRRNVSAVLLEIGYPTLQGYLPAENWQSILMEVVIEQLEESMVLNDLSQSFVDTPAVATVVDSFDKSKVETPPPKERRLKEGAPAIQRPFKRDYLEQEARNRSLGAAGELFVMQYEQWRLSTAGLAQLAEMVRHVSAEDGDGLGYDIRSYETNGVERFIEVKTTAFSEMTPFFVSSNEVRFARNCSEQFSLYRLFNFRAEPRFFELRGAIETHCSMDPATYRASLH
jgi:hypothetical protein